VKEVVTKAAGKGLILFFLLWEKNALRISPPLTISKRQILHGCRIILDILDHSEIKVNNFVNKKKR
jgi:4-aminobutyrate aminotransferase-like enzyme